MKPGVLIAAAALAVNGPRLVLAFLAADGVQVDPDLRRALLAATGWATGLVLTGGGAFLAHRAAALPRGRSGLLVAWVAVLVFSAVLIPPLLVAGMDHGGRMAQLLAQPWQRWTWAVVAVLAVEVIAAGAMLAEVRAGAQSSELEELEAQVLQLAAERNQLRQRLSSQLSSREQGAQPDSSERRAAPAAPAVPTPCRNGCGATFASSAAERGHQRACPCKDQPGMPRPTTAATSHGSPSQREESP